jgi:hypothetical protein
MPWHDSSLCGYGDQHSMWFWHMRDQGPSCQPPYFAFRFKVLGSELIYFFSNRCLNTHRQTLHRIISNFGFAFRVSKNAQTSSAALWSFFFRKSCFFGDMLSCREDFDVGDLCITASLCGEKVMFTTSFSGSLGGVEMAWEAKALSGTGVTRSFASETTFVSEGFLIVLVSLSIR